MGTKSCVRFLPHLGVGGAVSATETAQSKVTSAMVFDYTALKEKYDISLSMIAYGDGSDETDASVETEDKPF